MTDRRKFIKTVGIASVGLLPGLSSLGGSSGRSYISKRPASDKRRFISSAVEETILEVKKAIADQELAWMFENCFPNTLDTTVTYTEKNGNPFTYVITGDIDAMWLRDSSAQVWPYLPLANKDEKLKKLLKG